MQLDLTTQIYIVGGTLAGVLLIVGLMVMILALNITRYNLATSLLYLVFIVYIITYIFSFIYKHSLMVMIIALNITRHNLSYDQRFMFTRKPANHTSRISLLKFAGTSDRAVGP